MIAVSYTHLFMAAMMVPAQLTIIPNYFIVKALGLMDSLGSLIALGAFSAFAIFLIRQFFMSLPLELDDAAKIDGCGYFRSYLLIHFPLAKSVLSVNAILCFNGAWGDFFNPLIFLKSIENMTLPLGLSMLQGMYSQQSPAVNVATMVVAPVSYTHLDVYKRQGKYLLDEPYRLYFESSGRLSSDCSN